MSATSGAPLVGDGTEREAAGTASGTIVHSVRGGTRAL